MIRKVIQCAAWQGLDDRMPRGIVDICLTTGGRRPSVSDTDSAAVGQY